MLDMSRLAPHIFALLFILAAALTLPLAPPAKAQSPKLEKHFQLYQQLKEQGKNKQAILRLELVLRLAAKELGPTHQITIAQMNNLAGLYKAQGRFSDAKKLYKTNLANMEKDLTTDHPLLATTLNNFALLYKAQGHYDKAELHYKRSLKISETKLGRDHPSLAGILNNLASLLEAQGRYPEAEPLYKRSLKIKEKSLGRNHSSVAITLNNLAGLYLTQGRYTEAEPLYKRSLKIMQKTEGADHPGIATIFNNLASLYEKQGRYSKAEPLYKRSLKIRLEALGPEHPHVASTLNNLAGLYSSQGRYSEAEPLYKRDLAITQEVLGAEHPNVATSINNLASLYKAQKRYTEAEPLYKRSQKIFEKALGPNHPNVASSLNALAALYTDLGRYSEAEPLYERSLKIFEKKLGLKHPSLARTLNNFAALSRLQGRYSKAERLYKRSLKIFETTLGSNHPAVATTYNNLAALSESQGKYAKAIQSMKYSLKIYVKALGSTHPSVATTLNNLAALSFAQSHWRKAANSWRDATAILTLRAARSATIGQGVRGRKKSEVALNNWYFSGLVKSVYRYDRSRKAERETFQAAQWAIGSQAAGALAQMSVRKAAGSGKLAKLVRERQDKVRQWQASEQRMNKLRGAGKRNKKLARKMAALDRRIGNIDKRLAREFPDYAALASAKPLSVQQVQKLLEPDEALVLLLDTPKAFSSGREITPAETFVWAVTRDQFIWKRAALGGEELADKVAKLRCGLDGSNWADPASWPAQSDWEKQSKKAQQTRRDKCIRLIGRAYREIDWPPFSFDTAHELYEKLLAPLAPVIKGKKLLVAASGALTGLPLQVLTTGATNSNGSTDAATYQNAPWLIREYAITTLPSVASLKALRGIGKKAAPAEEPLIAFGDPLFYLPGNDMILTASEKQKKAQECGKLTRSASHAVTRSYASFFNGRNASLSTLSQSLAQLDGTRCELNAIAKVLNIKRQSIKLGRAASERAVKEAALDQYRIVYFATHGLIAGEVRGLGEPALAFSLPAIASPLDDGLLTASEVTDLKLNAEWLVMSACNTAAGDRPGAEALSGLARAFFYAGAKTLLVSHWPVGDAAAVKLTTHTFKNMKTHTETGKAEALRRSMLAMINKGKIANTHPTSWAPFVVVGEGGRQ